LRRSSIGFSDTRASAPLDAWIVRRESRNGLATMAYNLKRITNVLGAAKVTAAFRQA
jgi:hypothetical protein